MLLVLSSVAFFVAVLAIGELIARSLESADALDPAALGTLHQFSEIYGWEPRPGVVLRIGDRTVSVNEDGHRGRAYPQKREAGRSRALVLGDSITFGLDVGDHATFSMLLDVQSPDWEVINRGVQGYGTDQELLLLENVGLGYSPDVVILNICVANDFVDNTLDRFLYDPRHPKPFFRMEDRELVLDSSGLRVGWAERVARESLEASALFRRIVGAGSGGTQPRQHWTRRALEVTRNPVPVGQLATALIRRMEGLANAAGARLLVVVHPNRRSWREGSELLDELVRQLASSDEPALPRLWVDLADAYRRRGLELEDLTLDRLGHLNVRGHQVVAEILGERLDELATQLPIGERPPAR